MVNLASVLLARAAQREHEFAVSRALGANRASIVHAMLLEGGLLGLGGGVAAALAAIWGMRTLIALAPLDLPRCEAVAVDGGIAAVVIGLGVLLGLLAAIAPAAWAARAALSSLLASSAVRGGGGHGHMRRAMVGAQVTLSLVLLSTGGLVVRSFERLLRADPGFRPEGLLTVRVRMPPEFIPTAADLLALQERFEQELARQFFPTGDPLGAKILFRDQSLTVVGVVEQARLYDVHRDGLPQLSSGRRTGVTALSPGCYEPGGNRTP